MGFVFWSKLRGSPAFTAIRLYYVVGNWDACSIIALKSDTAALICNRNNFIAQLRGVQGVLPHPGPDAVPHGEERVQGGHGDEDRLHLLQKERGDVDDVEELRRTDGEKNTRDGDAATTFPATTRVFRE